MNIGQFPQRRMRRLRRTGFFRDLVRESSLSSSDLLYPVFLQEGNNKREAIGSMPGVYRLSLDLLYPIVEKAVRLGIPAIALFPVIDKKNKTPGGDEAFNPDGLVPRAVIELKKRFPDVGIICDVALDPYTSHGQDGVVDDTGYILNDETIAVLEKQAVMQAMAGVDIVAPSDMMDGRIGAIRKALDAKGLIHTAILAYAAKYASSFYGPFRDAAQSPPQFGDRHSYQMDPANVREALREAELDVAEGADMLMVKPALAYLDVVRRVRDTFNLPLAAYNVSGEYSMVKAAAARGWIDEQKVVLESLMGIKRAGADLILTYHAKDAARWLHLANG